MAEHKGKKEAPKKKEVPAPKKSWITEIKANRAQKDPLMLSLKAQKQEKKK